MNPWAPSSSADGGDAYGAGYAAPYRVSLGGVKAFVTRNQLHDSSGLCVDASAYSSVQLTDKIDTLTQLKTSALQRVRELEQVEAEISAGGLLLPRQLEARMDTVKLLRGDLEELLAMKSVLLRTLQTNVASEYLDVEMQHQRTFIDLLLKLSDELPRYATSAIATTQHSNSQANVAHELRQRHHDYETAVAQCKATIAKFHLIRDDTARVRAAYTQLYQSTVTSAADSPAFAG